MIEKRRHSAGLANAKRVIVKIGSALLVDQESGGIRRKWLNAAWKPGSKMQARLPNETVSGVFRGIDTTGRLAIELRDGSKRMIDAGDVFAMPD